MIQLNPSHPIYTANDFYKELYGKKAVKLSFDCGFTCPNRDGTLSNGGCIFCSGKGSGDFAGDRKTDFKEQYFSQIRLIGDKWKNCVYIAYLQAFTNTYAPTEHLKKIYSEIIALPDICGLSVATRPDCIDEQKAELLANINEKMPVFVELGLQTANEKTAKRINRCYENKVYENAVTLLKKKNINVVTHIILGLPEEDYSDMLSSVRYAVKSGTDGLKLQLLHILKGTELERQYLKAPFPLFTLDSYTDTIVDLAQEIPANIVLHRITGDGKKEELVAPLWPLDKRRVLNTIHRKFKERNTHQGKKVYL